MLDKALVLPQFRRFFFQNFPKSLSEAIHLSQIGDIPCLCLPEFLALEGAKSSLGLQNLTLGVQVQPQNNTKCRPCSYEFGSKNISKIDLEKWHFNTESYGLVVKVTPMLPYNFGPPGYVC